MELQIRLNTYGECPIESIATFLEENGPVSSTFAPLGDNVYAVTAEKCGKVTQIVPITSGGISLELAQEGV
jgi:hypothetical protein